MCGVNHEIYEADRGTQSKFSFIDFMETGRVPPEKILDQLSKMKA
jgi:hypothetical protein